MQTKSFVTVQFKLDDDEKETMKNALEIMRKFKEKFLTSNMPKHKELVTEYSQLLYDIVNGKEISE